MAALAAKGALTLGQIILGTGVAAGVAGGVGASLLSGKGGSSNILRPSPVSGGVRDTTNIPVGVVQRFSPVKELQNAIGKMIGSTNTSIIRYRYPKGKTSTISTLKDTLTHSPKFIEDIVGIVGKNLADIGSSEDIISIIQSDNSKRQALLDALKALQLPDAPNFNLGSSQSTSPSPDSGDPDSGSVNTDAINEVKDATNKASPTETDTGSTNKTIGKNTNSTNNKTNTKTNTRGRTKIDTRTKTETEEEEEEKKRPEPPEPPEQPEEKPKPETSITERPVSEIKRKMNTLNQWYPEYSLGGQNILKLTDTEKLEELKSYTLFDLVNPLLIGDEDNLLALQNKIQENRRFTNTYPNPRPERPLPPAPNVESWRNQMTSVYPTAYPMSLNMPQAQNYQEHWANQDYQYLAKNIDAIARGGTFDCDLQQVLNSKRDGYTATDRRIMRHTSNAKPSLLEDLDSGSISQLDLMMIR